MQALPTNAELAILGARDAGTFLVELRSNPEGYRNFIKARERGWEDPLRQPVHRCVEHLISLLIRTIETGLSGEGDMRLSTKEMLFFHNNEGAPNNGAGAPGTERGGRVGKEPKRPQPHAPMGDDDDLADHDVGGGGGGGGGGGMSVFASLMGGGGGKPAAKAGCAGALSTELALGARAWGGRGKAAAAGLKAAVQGAAAGAPQPPMPPPALGGGRKGPAGLNINLLKVMNAAAASGADAPDAAALSKLSPPRAGAGGLEESGMAPAPPVGPAPPVRTSPGPRTARNAFARAVLAEVAVDESGLKINY